MIKTKTKLTYPLFFPTSVTVFIIAKTSKFSDVQFAFVNILRKIKCNCMTGLFCIANLLKVGRKKHFRKFHGFQPPLNENAVKYSYSESVLIEMALKLAKSQKAKKK